MEQGRLLSPGQPELSIEELIRRIAASPPPGRRRSPSGPDSGLPPAGTGTVAARLRGDHDLNPDFYEPDQQLVRAAVLVPIVEHPRDLTVLFTRRTDHLYVHAGQISFPGGRLEAGEGPEAAALRETEEEVGLPATHVRIVGRLDTYVTGTGFEVVPVVGGVRPPYPVEPDSFEVAEVFEVPLGFFLAPGSRQRHSRQFEGRQRHFYAFPYEDYFIWGATAGMLVNLADVLTAEAAG